MRPRTSSDNDRPGQAVMDNKAKFAALNKFINSAGSAWITSIPGKPEITIEALVSSPLLDQLIELGYELKPADPPTGQRIIAGTVVERLTLTSSGAFEPLTEGSTKPVAEVRHHSGIARVLRYTFAI